VSDFWCISTYFNPGASVRRRRNLDEFLRFLELPLLLIELNDRGSPTVPCRDGCRVMAIAGETHLWQKERLLNIAVDALPDTVRYVAWLYCDVVLGETGWPDMARRQLLEDGGVLQLFSSAHQLHEEVDTTGLDRTSVFSAPTTDYAQSFARAAERGRLATGDALRGLVDCWAGDGRRDVAVADSRPQPGFAWAARREDLRRWRFYKHFVLGGGDRAFALAAAGRADLYLTKRPLTAAHGAHYRRWANHLAAGVRGRVSALPGELRHLWHGSPRHRQYRTRFDILLEHAFDPVRDVVAPAGRGLAWREPRGALARAARDYFLQRREDG
jgi:hypothetical protein